MTRSGDFKALLNMGAQIVEHGNFSAQRRRCMSDRGKLNEERSNGLKEALQVAPWIELTPAFSAQNALLLSGIQSNDSATSKRF